MVATGWIKYIVDENTCPIYIHSEALNEEEQNVFDKMWPTSKLKENCTTEFFDSCEKLFLFSFSDSGLMVNVVNDNNNATIIREKASYRDVD